MDKKLLMKVGIGAGVLVLGFLAYKKFVAKPKDTKSAEAEPEEEKSVEEETKAEPTKAEPTKPTATTKSTKIEKPQSTSEDISLGGGKMQKSQVKQMVKKGLFKGLGKEIKASATYTPQSTSEPISLGDGRMQISQDRQDEIKEQRKATLAKYGLTESDVKKLSEESNRISNLQKENTKLTSDEKRAQRFDFLRKFGKERNLNAEGYIKMQEAIREKSKAKKAERDILTGNTSFADFMDFDGNDDVQGSIM
jgi:hypothetical protein